MSAEKPTGWDHPKSRQRKSSAPQVDTIEKTVKKPFPISLDERLKERIQDIVDGPLPYPSMNKFINEAIVDKLEDVEPLHFEMVKKMEELEGLSPKEIRSRSNK